MYFQKITIFTAFVKTYIMDIKKNNSGVRMGYKPSLVATM